MRACMRVHTWICLQTKVGKSLPHLQANSYAYTSIHTHICTHTRSLHPSYVDHYRRHPTAYIHTYTHLHTITARLHVQHHGLHSDTWPRVHNTYNTHTRTQLAPMSTTTDISTAISYSISPQSLIFKILTKNKLQRGADLSFLSAAPTEAEVLFPPLTYLQPTGRTQTIELNNHSFTVVEVTPTLA